MHSKGVAHRDIKLENVLAQMELLDDQSGFGHGWCTPKTKGLPN